MKKYNIVETNAKGTTIKLRFQTGNKSKAEQILNDFRAENPDLEFHLLVLEN